MADPFSLIGGLAAIMQLSGSLVKLTKNLLYCMRTIRSAPEEIEAFILETQLFTDHLFYFHDLAKESTEKLNQEFKAKRAVLIQKIVRQCKFVRRGFARLVRRFIEINGSGTAPFKTLWARILWLWKKPDVLEVRLSILSATSNVHLLSNVFLFEEMRRRNEKDDKLVVLQEQLQNWMSIARKQRRKLAEYQSRKRPSERTLETAPDGSYDIITGNSRELEQYVTEAIKSYTRKVPLSGGPGSSRRDSPSRMEQETRTAPSSEGSRTNNTQADAPVRTGRSQRRKSSQSPEEIIEVRDSGVPHREGISSEVIARNAPDERSPSRSRGVPSPSLTPLEEFHQRTSGSRVRDKGSGVYMEVGEWPAEVHDSDAHITEVVKDGVIEQPSETEEARKSQIEEERRRESVSELSPNDAGQPIGAAQISKPSRPPSTVEERSQRDGPSVAPKTSSGIERNGPRNSHNSSGEESSGPYKPLPPFGGPRSRRRPRRPRPQSPIG
ncbi:hypothetical protein F5Y05DRAFT_231182 [Hypoxylon sp. FL0543]|nr:hypothetical protein F5Y05DRAFT_231182 [Hypoxylon sp. FL0543]